MPRVMIKRPAGSATDDEAVDGDPADTGDLEESYEDGERLFDIGRRAGVEIETACVGKGTCGLCRVRVVAGEEFLNPYTEAEQKHLGNVYFLTKIRLSCRTVVAGGDVTIELPRPRKRKQKRAAGGPPGDRRGSSR